MGKKKAARKAAKRRKTKRLKRKTRHRARGSHPLAGALEKILRGFRFLPQDAVSQAVTLTHLRLLDACASSGTKTKGRGVGELAVMVGLTQSSTTRATQAMERMGLVRRRRSKPDRRHVRVSGTARGRSLRIAYAKWLGAYVSALEAAMGEKNAAAVTRSLDLLLDADSAATASLAQAARVGPGEEFNIVAAVVNRLRVPVKRTRRRARKRRR